MQFSSLVGEPHTPKLHPTPAFFDFFPIIFSKS